MRLIALITAGFLLLSTFEVWAGFWLAGRWFVSSRSATVSLGTVKRWLDRGIITRTTEWVKVFVNRNGKWIILTLGLSQVISEVENLRASSEYCYAPYPHNIWVGWTSWGTLTVQAGGNNPANFYTVSYSSRCYSGSAYIPSVEIRKWLKPWNRNTYQWVYYAHVPKPGTYQIGNCSVTFSLRNVGSVCPSDIYQGPSVDWSQRRRVPVRVFPRVEDFLRDDVINSDPALRWLRDEYQRLSSDSSIPTIPLDLLSDLDLPSIDWVISPDEALDHASERGSTSEGEGSLEGDISISGLDTKLDPVQRKSFPLELINQLVQNHPLLRILSSVRFDVSGGGSCVFGEGYFTIDFCRWQWVLNLMGSFLVPLAFLYGLLGIGGRSDE